MLQEKEESGEARTGNIKIGLDTKIASGGSNLSAGQRQIIALARALVRGSKLLILDEGQSIRPGHDEPADRLWHFLATSSIDHKTDAVIQTSLREELGKDVTVLVVAHRLQTVMDADRIVSRFPAIGNELTAYD